MRWLLSVLQKEIYTHKRDVQVINNNLVRLREKWVAASSNAAQKTHKHAEKKESARTTQAKDLAHEKYMAARGAAERLNAKHDIEYNLERDKAAVLVAELAGMREKEADLKKRLAKSVKKLTGSPKTHDDIDRETSKVAMDKWIAEEDRAFSSLLPNLGDADHLRQLAHLRAGTIDTFHLARAAEHKKAADKVKLLEDRIRRHNASRERQLQHEMLVRERQASQYEAQMHFHELEMERAETARRHDFGSAQAYSNLHHLAGTYGPGW